MSLFHKKSIPQPNIETARQILAHAFERNQREPNSVPLEQLESYSNYRRERYSLQRSILVAMMTLFVLLPLLFIPPSFTLSDETDRGEWNPSYRLTLNTFMLVDTLNVQIDGRSIPVYEVDSHVYSIEPTKKGQMDITVTLLNRQVLTQSIPITNVDKDTPTIQDYWIVDNRLYISLSDAGSGICYSGIYATSVDGEEIPPIRIDEEIGCVVFEEPRSLLNISIPDNTDNILQVMIVLNQ